MNTALEDLLSRLPRWRRSDIAAGPRGLDSDFDQLCADAAAELAALKAATAERECVAGRCVEAGDDDAGQPHLLIHTTREELMRYGRNLVFSDVEVRLKQ